MLSNILSQPICVFHVGEFGKIAQDYLINIKSQFFDLTPDMYLLRQKQLEFLIENGQQKSNKTRMDDNCEFFSNYFAGDLDASCLNHLLNELDNKQLSAYKAIKPSRQRSIADFKLFCTPSEIQIERITKSGFQQQHALISSATKQRDWRICERHFTQADDLFVSEGLYHIIRGVANKILKCNPDIMSFDLAVHFTHITSTIDAISSNSPEGIHQDGMDYIVSALVVNRENALGSKSIIYGKDKTTPLLETTLMPGFGILQPDKDTDLWHCVEPIVPENTTVTACRSTIGFDFAISN
jgi:2OG-Fe dioxygenase